MTYLHNPHDPTVSPILHGMVAQEQANRAMGCAPKDPYFGIPLNAPAPQPPAPSGYRATASAGTYSPQPPGAAAAPSAPWTARTWIRLLNLSIVGLIAFGAYRLSHQPPTLPAAPVKLQHLAQVGYGYRVASAGGACLHTADRARSKTPWCFKRGTLIKGFAAPTPYDPPAMAGKWVQVLAMVSPGPVPYAFKVSDLAATGEP